MNEPRTSTWLLALILFALTLPLVSALAADSPPDSGSVTAALKLSWVQWLIPIVVPAIIAGLKKIFPNIPGALLPFLCPGLGWLADFVAKLAGTEGAGPEVAAALGALGLYLRELFDQSKKSLVGRDGSSGGSGGYKYAPAILLFIALSAVSVRAAEPLPPAPNFRAGLSLDQFVAATAEDLTGHVDYGGGVGANYFFTRGFGAGARITAWDTTDRFVDEIAGRLIARAPLWDRIAPYGYVEGTYNIREGRFKDGKWGAGAGGGLEIAITRHIGIKGEAGLRVETNGRGSFVGTGGLTVPF